MKVNVDELIKFCEKKIDNIKLKAEPQVFVEIKQALEEFKYMKELGAQKIRDKAIDTYMNKLCEHCMRQTNECHSLECPFCSDSCDIVNIAEKLKAGD